MCFKKKGIKINLKQDSNLMKKKQYSIRNLMTAQIISTNAAMQLPSF